MKLKLVAIVLLLPIMINLLVFNSTEIVVEAQTIRVTEVTLDTDDLVFDRLGTTRSLIATVMPAQATNRRVAFSSSNEDVAKVDDHGVVTSIANGIAHVTVTTEDGNFSATSTVRVQSFFVEKFEVSVLGSQELFQDETAEIRVVISTKESMIESAPLVRMTESDVLDVTPFTLLEENTTSRTFTATVTANREGLSSVVVFFTERQTGVEQSHSALVFNVLATEGGPLGVFFNGRTYSEERPLVTIRNEIPLILNRDRGDASFSFEDNVDDIAQIVGDNLVFEEAGTITLNFTSGDESGSVRITSTNQQIDEESKDNLIKLGSINVFFGGSESIRLDIVPTDFSLYYDVEWISTAAIRVQILSLTNVSIMPTNSGAINQSVTVNFNHKEDSSASFSHTFNVNIEIFGASEISFELNAPAFSTRGLEQTLVFGNQTFDGRNFNHQIRFSYLGASGAMILLEFTSSNHEIAEVNNNGLVTFKRDFDKFDEDGRAFVTITARSVHPTLADANVYATEEFTFEVIKAANVHNFNEYNIANNANRDIVLQNSISFAMPYITSVSVFGNGFTMDAFEFTNTLNASDVEIFIFRNLANFIEDNKTLITNVVFAGFADSIEDAGFGVLQTKGTLVTINANTTLQYSVLERAAMLLSIGVDTSIDQTVYTNRNINVNKNLFRDAGTAGSILGFSHDVGNKAENIVFEDLIFERSLIGIVFAPGETEDNLGTFEFTVKGDLKFYTWIEYSKLQEMTAAMTIMGFAVDLNLSSFNFETALDQDETKFVLLSIVIIEAFNLNVPTIGNYNLITRALFEEETGLKLGEILSRIQNETENPKNGSLFDVNVFSGRARAVAEGIGTMNFNVRASVYNPNSASSNFISPTLQQAHFANPDYSLITSQVN